LIIFVKKMQRKKIDPFRTQRKEPNRINFLKNTQQKILKFSNCVKTLKTWYFSSLFCPIKLYTRSGSRPALVSDTGSDFNLWERVLGLFNPSPLPVHGTMQTNWNP